MEQGVFLKSGGGGKKKKMGNTERRGQRAWGRARTGRRRGAWVSVRKRTHIIAKSREGWLRGGGGHNKGGREENQQKNSMKAGG